MEIGLTAGYRRIQGDGTCYTSWGIGGVNPAKYRDAVAAGRVDVDIPVNHNPAIAPVIHPLDIGTHALVVAALAWHTPTDRSAGDPRGPAA